MNILNSFVVQSLEHLTWQLNVESKNAETIREFLYFGNIM